MLDIQAVCFDLDGTLVDSGPFNHHMIRRVAQRHGGDLSEEDWAIVNSLGMPAIYAHVKQRFPGLNIEQEAFINASADLSGLNGLSATFKVAACPGMREIIGYCHGLHVPMAVVTNAPRALMEHHMRSAGGFPEIHWHNTACDVKAAGRSPKPSPDPYLMAAERFKLSPRQCLAYEDSDAGQKSALAAGMRVIRIWDGKGVKPDKTPYIARTADDLIRLTRELIPA